jgi:hypothetical protein
LRDVLRSGNRPQEFAAFIHTEHARWGKGVRDARTSQGSETTDGDACREAAIPRTLSAVN